LNELKISIDNVNPAVLWGPNNDHFEIIKKQYPKLKLVARGSELKVLGDDHELAVFDEKFKIHIYIWVPDDPHAKAGMPTVFAQLFAH